MARRQSKKDAGKPANLTPQAAVSHEETGQERAVVEQLLSLQRERDALRVDLEAAHARISHLENRESNLADRIAWTIDSLHSLLDEKR
jgi:hypothetical protein